MPETLGLPDDDFRRQLIGLPTMKLNTPATLPGVSPPVAPLPKYEQPSTAVGVPPQNEPIPKVMSPLESQINQNLGERNRLEATGSGVSQIRNPFLRGIARIGDVLASGNPNFAAAIPGTTLHHQALLNQNIGDLGKLEGAQKEEAQTKLEEARAKKAAEPPKLTPEEQAFEYQKTLGNNPTQALGAVKQVTQDVKPEGKDEQQTRYAELRNKSATAPLAGAELDEFNKLQTKFSVGKGAEQWDARILGELNANPHTKIAAIPPELHVLPTDTDAEAQAKFNAAKERVSAATAQQHVSVSVANQGDKGAQSVFVPNDPNDPSKGYTLRYVKPGESIHPGTVSKSGFDQANKASAEEAQAKQQIQKDYALAQKLAANPSATNDYALLIRFIGDTKPEGLAKLRLNNNEIKLVTGARSLFGDLEALEQKVLNGQKLTSDQRQQMLETLRLIAESKGEVGGAQGAGTRPPLSSFEKK